MDAVPLRTLCAFVGERRVFLRDENSSRTWLIEAEDGRTMRETLAVVLRLAGSDLAHLRFDVPLDRQRMYDLLAATDR